MKAIKLIAIILGMVAITSCENSSNDRTVRFVSNGQLVNIKTNLPYQKGDTIQLSKRNKLDWIVINSLDSLTERTVIIGDSNINITIYKIGIVIK